MKKYDIIILTQNVPYCDSVEIEAEDEESAREIIENLLSEDEEFMEELLHNSTGVYEEAEQIMEIVSVNERS